MKTAVPTQPSKVSTRYLRLIRAFPLRPLRNDADLEAATAILDQHFIREDLDPGEADYVQTLAILVDEYDRKHHPVAAPEMAPIERLKSLMRESSMTTADLGRVLGNSGLASQILKGKRGISKAIARTLGERFAIDPGVFI